MNFKHFFKIFLKALDTHGNINNDPKDVVNFSEYFLQS